MWSSYCLPIGSSPGQNASASDSLTITACVSPFENIRHYFLDAGNDSLLAFFEIPKGAKPKADRDAIGTMQHVSFAVSEEKFNQIRNSVEEAGLSILGPINVGCDTWSMYFYDPNGIRLEIATDKGKHRTDALDVVKSCTQTPDEVRRELATLTDDAAWIARMLATVPQGR